MTTTVRETGRPAAQSMVWPLRPSASRLGLAAAQDAYPAGELEHH